MGYKLRYIFILLGVFTLSINVFAQDPIIDSLKLALKNAKHDSTRCNILNELVETTGDEEWPLYNDQLLKLAKKCADKAPDNSQQKKTYLQHFGDALNNIAFLALEQGDVAKALDYGYKGLKIHEEIKNKKGKAVSLNNIGTSYENKGDIPKALEYYNKALKIKEELNDKIGIAITLNNIGTIHEHLGDIAKAIEYYHRSLKIYEGINNKTRIVFSLNNIGSLYMNQGDITKALEYYNKSLKMSEEIKDKNGIAFTLNNLGVAYHWQNNIFKALEYYQRSLKISEEIKDKDGIALCINNIGDIYNEQNNIPKALEYYHRSLKIFEEINIKEGITLSLNGIANVLLKKGQLGEAMKFAERTLQSAKEIGYPERIKKAAVTLKKIYQKQNKYKEALEMYELEIQMHDSINNLETKRASVKKQFQYLYEKKAAEDSVKNNEEQKVKNALLTAQHAQLKQEKTKSYALYGGLALVMIFAGFMVNRFRVIHKQKQIIELKEIETQKQNEIITHQKHLVEEKHKEITDSINYAERIQRSFLATKELLDENLNEYFVFFQPKDVVSGDFYWASKIVSSSGVENFILVTADSTGHGVPGAIMSILNISCLEKSVEEEKLTNPSDILNHTRLKIIERLKKDGSPDGGKDGMDCSLICLESPSLNGKDGRVRMTYAAANNPVWIVRNVSSSGVENKKELIELVPDKMPVGKHDNDFVPFTQHSIDLQKGDMVYALTDGLPDQFGGPKGKKFLYKQLKQLLINNSQLPVHEQKEILKTALTNWKGDLEQVDDVCLIGVRI